ncbi:MAG: hypothetical protein LBE12_11270 [Planctomycetaceae bacterium]|nr:hypothetical protein [Planctomycetaceae bacterium]
MSQANYYHNGNNSACDTLHSQLSTIILPLQGFGVLYLLRRALPYAIAGCLFNAILMNT